MFSNPSPSRLLCVHFGIRDLVAHGGRRQWNQQGRQAKHRQLRQCQRPGGRDHEICFQVCGRHINDECINPSVDFQPLIFPTHPLGFTFARLVTDRDGNAQIPNTC